MYCSIASMLRADFDKCLQFRIFHHCVSCSSTTSCVPNCTGTRVFAVFAFICWSRLSQVILQIYVLNAGAQVWGVTIGATILQNKLTELLPPLFLDDFPKGAMIAYALIPQVPTVPQPLRKAVQDAFADSLRILWYVLIGITGVGFLSSLLMEGLPLHTKLDRDWAMPEGKAEGDNDSKNAMDSH